MYLTQILLPLYDNEKKPFGKQHFTEVSNFLAKLFGGVTVYQHAPAEGIWSNDNNETNYDKVIIAEVMNNKIDYRFWKQYKAQLEKDFRQDEIIIRVSTFEKIV